MKGNEGRLDNGSGEGEEGQDLGERRWQVEVYEELNVGMNRNVEVQNEVRPVMMDIAVQ